MLKLTLFGVIGIKTPTAQQTIIKKSNQKWLKSK